MINAVGVVGRQERFKTLATITAANGVHLKVWEPEKTSGALPEHATRVSLEELADAPLIFLCVEVEDARAAARRLGDVISGRHAVVHMSRALEEGSGATLSEMLRDELATHRIAFLTGPMRQVDVDNDLNSACTVYSRFPEIHALAEEVLVSPRFRLYRSRDLAGAEAVAAYTRIIAFVYGVGLGMKQGASVGATLFARGLAEVGRVAIAKGGEEHTVFGMAGAGNLFADTQDPVSVDVQMGIASVELEDFHVEQMVERFGPSAQRLFDLVQVMHVYCEREGIVASIIKTAQAMMTEEMNTKEAARYLMTLPVLDE